jgi:hypothetical protein
MKNVPGDPALQLIPGGRPIWKPDHRVAVDRQGSWGP